MRKIVFILVGTIVLGGGAQLSAQTTLKGSRATMQRQNSVAQNHDFTFLRTSSDVKRFVELGLLVPVRNTSTLSLADVSHPYARPAVKLFAERLASQYHASCGRKLVVTSLTRPVDRQPANASDLSVHPAGMALDIRVSDRRACRQWLEKTLVSLEKKGVIDATRERNPAHYHVAVFPARYEQYVAQLEGRPAVRLAKAAAAQPAAGGGSEGALTKASGHGEAAAVDDEKIAHAEEPAYASVVPLPSAARHVRHKVKTGETLWSIARRYGVTVAALQEANELATSHIRPGQILSVPRRLSAAGD